MATFWGFRRLRAVASDWAYVDTASIIDIAAVDFWDFHAYHDTYETLFNSSCTCNSSLGDG